MWSGHYFRFLGRWTPAIDAAPRWLAANGRPEVDDEIELPELRDAIVYASPTVAASGYVLPGTWDVSSGVPDTSGDLLEGIIHIQAEEAEVLHPSAEAMYRSTAWGYDMSEPQFGWVLPYSEEVHTVELLTEDGWVELPKAESDLGLFWSGTRSYRNDSDTILIFGLDFLPLTSEIHEGWQFLPSPCPWDIEGPVFVEHPTTKSWIPLHPSLIRPDGLLGYYYEETLRVKVRSNEAAAQLPMVFVRVNGQELTAIRVNLSTSLDDKGMLVGIERRTGETLGSYDLAIRQALWFGRGQNPDAVRSYLSAALRTGTLSSIDQDSTNITLSPGQTGFSILGEEQTQFVVEVPVSRDVDTPVRYRTLLADPERGTAFLRGKYAAFEDMEDGTIRLQTEVRNHVDRPHLSWVVNYWTPNASGAVFTENFKLTAPTPVLYASKVDVVEPSQNTLRLAMERSSPFLRWRSNPDSPDAVKGSAVFD